MLNFLKKLYSQNNKKDDIFMIRSRFYTPGSTSRRIYLNLPLPSHLIDKHGAPKVKYKSNKIITAKYNLL